MALDERTTSGNRACPGLNERLLPATDGARYRQILVAPLRDGGVRLTDFEFGDEGLWGLDERELTVSIAPEDVACLASKLLAERLNGDVNAAKTLTALCRDHGIEPMIVDWS